MNWEDLFGKSLFAFLVLETKRERDRDSDSREVLTWVVDFFGLSKATELAALSLPRLIIKTCFCFEIIIIMSSRLVVVLYNNNNKIYPKKIIIIIIVHGDVGTGIWGERLTKIFSRWIRNMLSSLCVFWLFFSQIVYFFFSLFFF